MHNFDDADGMTAHRLAIAARAASLGIWDWDLVTNRFVYSDRAREICGLPAEGEITLDAIRALTHPDDLPHTREQARRALDPGIRNNDIYRYRIRRADTGEERWVLAHGEAVFAEVEGQPRAVRYIGTLQDITEQKLAEDRTAASEARLRLAVAASGMAVWDYDIASHTVSHSPELNMLFGFPPDAHPTLEAFRERYAPGERERVQSEGAAVLARGETMLQTDFRIVLPGGGERWLLMRAQIEPGASEAGGRIIGVLMDVTERRIAEDRFRHLADNAPVVIWISDEEDRVTFMSRSWVSFTGQEIAQALGRGWLDRVHPEDRDAAARASMEAARSGTRYEAEYRLRSADGGWRWVLDTAEPRHDNLGVFRGHIGSVVDITDRKAEEARRTLLIGELNHRIRNNLALVQSLVLQTLKGNPAAEAAGATISARLRALGEAHDSLTRSDWRRAPLRQLVQRAVAPFHGERMPRFDIDGPDVALSPRAAVALSLSLHELATNAAKYGALAGETGRVGITWSVDAADNRFVLEWRERGGPAVAPPRRSGFGTRLIERSVGGELSAAVETDYAPEGLTCTIRAPLAMVLPGDG